ncbi:glyoxalase/bleomycin resistance /dioxygenase domain protein [Mycobacterium xenopi 3993]|nr:glyoxalase/bleomycin resistance /dioxygenase domain protein [Mycobacterium xenopi 3993]
MGAPTWIDLTSSDVDRARDFYGIVFGWTFEAAGPEYGGYINAAKDGHPVAGLMANNPEWQARTAGPSFSTPTTSTPLCRR